MTEQFHNALLLVCLGCLSCGGGDRLSGKDGALVRQSPTDSGGTDEPYPITADNGGTDELAPVTAANPSRRDTAGEANELPAVSGEPIVPKPLAEWAFEKLPQKAKQAVRRHLREHPHEDTLESAPMPFHLPVKKAYRFGDGYLVAAFVASTAIAQSRILYWDGKLRVVDVSTVSTPAGFSDIDGILQVDYDWGCCDGRYMGRMWFAPDDDGFEKLFDTVLHIGREFWFGKISLYLSTETSYFQQPETDRLTVLVSQRLRVDTKPPVTDVPPRTWVFDTELIIEAGRLKTAKGKNAPAEAVLEGLRTGKMGGRPVRTDGTVFPYMRWVEDALSAEPAPAK